MLEVYGWCHLQRRDPGERETHGRLAGDGVLAHQDETTLVPGQGLPAVLRGALVARIARSFAGSGQEKREGAHRYVRTE